MADLKVRQLDDRVARALKSRAEGYEIYERRKPDGTVARRLPALNFLAAPVATAGVATALVAIEVGPPASGPFGPPAQAAVRTSSVPGGIVALPAPPPGEGR